MSDDLGVVLRDALDRIEALEARNRALEEAVETVARIRELNPGTSDRLLFDVCITVCAEALDV